MKFAQTLSLTTLIFLLFSHQKYSSLADLKVIYDEDDRVELADSHDPRFLEWGRSVFAQIPSTLVDGNLNLLSMRQGDVFSLCSNERFFNQLSSVACSGFLVGQDIVVTAGHCVSNQAMCRQYLWVLDYVEGTTQLDQRQIYRCNKIIKHSEDLDTGLDYAIIQLDRPAHGRTPLKMRTYGDIQVGQRVAMIGYPGGLPIKVMDNAVVLRNYAHKPYFISNLDAFVGSSGAPVFNLDTGLVEGILTKGETDYQLTLNSEGRFCQSSRICSARECDGEEIVKTTAIKGIPAI